MGRKAEYSGMSVRCQLTHFCVSTPLFSEHTPKFYVFLQFLEKTSISSIFIACSKLVKLKLFPSKISPNRSTRKPAAKQSKSKKTSLKTPPKAPKPILKLTLKENSQLASTTSTKPLASSYASANPVTLAPPPSESCVKLHICIIHFRVYSDINEGLSVILCDAS
jgi:hypothetical protein